MIRFVSKLKHALDTLVNVVKTTPLRLALQPSHSKRNLIRSERGQSIVVLAFAIIGILAIVGLGIDLGIVYIERVRIARAADAAALAGAFELPSETASHVRAIDYLIENDYNIDPATCSDGDGIKTCVDDEHGVQFTIETAPFRDEGVPDTADQIRVSGHRQVGLFFLRVVGFTSVPVSGSATAQNIQDLDIVIVYDRSGSMQEDTRCYGCWVSDGGEYPSGFNYPLMSTEHCQATNPLLEDGKYFISIEAEYYSRYKPLAGYHRDYTEYPQTWWAMQRNRGKNATGQDARGAFMKVGPNGAGVNYYNFSDVQADAASGDPILPRLEYDFTVPANGTYYVWIRAQGGASYSGGSWDHGRTQRRQVHLGLNGTPLATGNTCYWGPYGPYAGPGSASSSVRKNGNPPGGVCNTNSQGWSWSRVFQMNNLQAGTDYTLDVWAAGGGFSLDKIVITNDASTDLDRNDKPMDWADSGVSDGGPGETKGRTGWACHPLDPRFAPVYEGETDDLYDDQQPMRGAKQAAKAFVRRLNPRLDQIAYVTYSSNSGIVNELYCKVALGSCDDFENVVASIEATVPEGSTNIADAMWDGIRVLIDGPEPPLNPPNGFPSKDPLGDSHNGRSGSAHIMILMTDGQANKNPSMPAGYSACYSEDLWPPQAGETSAQARARDCVAWFARLARDQSVVVYTIGLGAQADNELLAHVAEVTGGWYYYAPDVGELDQIFEDLYERIFLRLVD